MPLINSTFVNTILTVLVAASQLTYEAKNTTFGCTSVEDVADLQSVRSDEKAFQTAFIQKAAYGECVEIPQGTVAEGSIEPNNSSMLLVLIEKAPPPFVAPLTDFKVTPAEGK
jgi:hypothetical protein